MSIQIIFFIGVLVFTIFIIGVLLIPRESKISSEEKIETDVMDYDGIGNYGRIPDKDPK
ncbi:hypothetical protein N9591_00135 [Flavobacteriaceae bacterium]|jgi:hypothetical protein|nr:hypothetical protein [Flavobacteriaceae bacterium]MDB4148149.1 hypothetical protein [Flavobacteriaceae bacterium]MDC0007994.1 hypothetical protein [Flavobacteriaceae bacterium]MDC1337010.1 hypothetical protein [Flavobacteriaceae bacterium]MDC1456929.1 hypothetical protein [Flavobacteriaceae bacterium]|tara:strand:- start:183 stop:359 length:177 start_codon:yes stop_codon:yes gene_type:complete